MDDALHRNFKDRLERSGPAVLAVARALTAKGYRVDVIPTTVAPTRDDAPKHSDNGDLYIKSAGDSFGGMHRIEVKHRPSTKFTSAETWDFPDGIMYLIAKDRWDAMDPKARAVVVVNGPMTHIAIAMAGEPWEVRKVRDNERGHEYDCYVCHVRYATFHKIGR